MAERKMETEQKSEGGVASERGRQAEDRSRS